MRYPQQLIRQAQRETKAVMTMKNKENNRILSALGVRKQVSLIVIAVPILQQWVFPAASGYEPLAIAKRGIMDGFISGYRRHDLPATPSDSLRPCNLVQLTRQQEAFQPRRAAHMGAAAAMAAAVTSWNHEPFGGAGAYLPSGHAAVMLP